MTKHPQGLSCFQLPQYSVITNHIFQTNRRFVGRFCNVSVFTSSITDDIGMICIYHYVMIYSWHQWFLLDKLMTKIT